MDPKPGKLYANGDGDILTVRERDEADRIVVDVEGSFKTFNDEQEFREYIEKQGFEETDSELDPEDMDLDMEDDEEDTDEQEDDEIIEPEDDEPAEDEGMSKIQKFKDLYNQMLELGSTGNDKIDNSVQKLKKALSDELNTMTAENVDFDELHNSLKEEGYIK